MASNEELLALARQGADAWNQCRRENLDWTGVRFTLGGYPRSRRWPFLLFSHRGLIKRLQHLRGIAAEIHAHDAERDLFILERQAERGVLWSEWWQGGWRARLFSWWRPLAATLLMFLYRWSSDCGRSAMLPLIWFLAANWGFYCLYMSLNERPLLIAVVKALKDFTIASAVPFGATARPAFDAAVKTLFTKVGESTPDIPLLVQFASATQGIVNLILVFLLGLALRNHFKVK